MYLAQSPNWGHFPEYPEKKPQSKDKNQQQTQPTYDA